MSNETHIKFSYISRLSSTFCLVKEEVKLINHEHKSFAMLLKGFYNFFLLQSSTIVRGSI
ncbi:CLUMA_CG019404, isoform A [Clunio marinus]|uniref:CLUMA_CG019404, isoform A n=1 Tax=Clunio marinus TaxID=568069 RepID=A0A1J1J612_9DIPT|nr:CLUMA_CG019404, isoform A [Clunio marinus]